MQKIFIKILLVWLFFSTFVVAILNKSNQVGFAKIVMACGLVLFWVVICGGVMLKFRDTFKAMFQKIPLSLGKKFFIFTVLLAMLEELIATAMTNTAPWFGLSLGQAYITASSNFWQVILHHSVIVFLPAFLAWTFLVKRYNFSANQAFWLFGITGTLMEVLTFGPQKILEFGLWIFVYGLMLYLPVYCLPEDRGARPVRFWHYPLVFIMPVVFMFGLFLIAVVLKNIFGPLPNFGPEFLPLNSKG